MKSLETAILRTLCYADIFDYPLTALEIDRYLIASPSNPGVKASSTPGLKYSFNTLAAHLSDLVQAKKLLQEGDYFALPQRRSIFQLRRKRAVASQIKLDKARSIARTLSKLPIILGIFVTGNLSMKNADTSDDIDLLIITRTNWLWTTRLFITFYLELLGRRRRPIHFQSRIGGNLDPGLSSYRYQDQLCLNMWLSQNALALPQNKRNLYTAHEVAQVMPIINKNQIYQRFLSANSWINHYLPHIDIKLVNQLSSQPVNQASLTERLAYALQRAYMKSKMTRESVSPQSAFFHPRDTGNQVLAKYQTQIKKIRIS